MSDRVAINRTLYLGDIGTHPAEIVGERFGAVINIARCIVLITHESYGVAQFDARPILSKQVKCWLRDELEQAFKDKDFEDAKKVRIEGEFSAEA